MVVYIDRRGRCKVALALLVCVVAALSLLRSDRPKRRIPKSGRNQELRSHMQETYEARRLLATPGGELTLGGPPRIPAQDEADEISCPEDLNGEWGEVFNMEIVPIHAVTLIDGNIFAFGAGPAGDNYNPEAFYEVWNTSSGEHTQGANHVRYVQETGVNIFCSTLSMDVKTGNVLILGGTVEPIVIFGQYVNVGVGERDAVEFDVETYEIETHSLGNMEYGRYYATSINLPDGCIFVAGGRGYSYFDISSIPEIWEPEKGFRTLPGADMPGMKRGIADQVGEWNTGSWWYPHVFVNSKTEIVVMMADEAQDDIYVVGVEDDGTIERVASRPFKTHKLGPSLMYDVDLVAVLDFPGNIWSMNISDASNPIFTKKSALASPRINAAMSLLPDGRVAITGGCDFDDYLDQGLDVGRAAHHVEIWDPVSDAVFQGPEQEIPRLYHSSGLILKDGSVFSGGGGAPGPLTNTNGQVYYPGYFKGGVRPVIKTGPETHLAGEAFSVTVDDASVIARVTATKPGSMTHARNCDARWLDLDFIVVSESEITVSTPGPNIMVSGLWHVNVIDSIGFPSEAHLLMVTLPEI